MFPPAFHCFSPIVFPICSPVRYTVTDMSQFRCYVMQRYSHRREGLPRRVGAELFWGSSEKSWVPRINLEFIINKPCLSRISFSKVLLSAKKCNLLSVKARFCIAEWMFQSLPFSGLEWGRGDEISLKCDSS